MRRCLTLAIVLSAVAGSAAAEGLCENLAVPAGTDLVCSVDAEGATVVRAPDSPFGPFNRLWIRQLDAPVDDPAAWLTEQMSFDTSGMSTLVERWANHPDNPIKPEVIAPSLETLFDALRDLEQLSRSGCSEPRERRGRWSMRCTYDAGIARGVVDLTLIETDGLPIHADARAASERRAREFEALVNGLRLD